MSNFTPGTSINLYVLQQYKRVPIALKYLPQEWVIFSNILLLEFEFLNS